MSFGLPEIMQTCLFGLEETSSQAFLLYLIMGDQEAVVR